MKFARAAALPQPSRPVTIVLETQADLDYVTALFAASSPSITSAYGVSDKETYLMFSDLRLHATPTYPRLKLEFA